MIVASTTTAMHAAQSKVLFVNFDGADIQWCGPGEDDPHDNCSTIFQGAVAPYSGNQAARAAVIQTVNADLADFDVTVTTLRPGDDVDYDMEVVGRWSPSPGGGFLGIAPKIDCFDGDGGDTSFTLDVETVAPSDIAKVILQEAAHTWGLEHVDSLGDLLFPTVGNAPDPKFEDQCSPITYEPSQCPRQHGMFCADGTLQNSYAEMLMLFGERQPDLVAPTLAILSPADGEQVPNDFHIVLELADDVAPQVLTTTIEFVDGFQTDVDLATPGVFPIALTDVADGVWTVRVTGADPSGNAAMAEITITVGQGSAADTSGGDSSGGGEGGGSSSGGVVDESSSSGAGESSGGGALDDDGGCSCGTTGGAPGMLAMVLIVLPAVRRRRTISA